MIYLLKVTLLGLVSGMIGTGIGGMAAFVIKKISNRILGFILEFSAGLMMAVVCFKLVPEALGLGGFFLTFTGIFLGVFAIIIIENFMKWYGFDDRANRILGQSGKRKYGRVKPADRSKLSGARYSAKRINTDAGLLKAGILVAIGIALHNFPEGFAVGSGFEVSASLGFTITAVIIMHDIPEGIAMAVPMRAGGFSRFKSFSLTMMSGMPMGLGALFGALLGEISQGFVAGCLGFAGGAMLYIVYAELIPESKRLYKGRLSSFGSVLGIICGIAVSLFN